MRGRRLRKGGINGDRNADQREDRYKARDEDGIEMMMTCMLKMEQTHVRVGKKIYERDGEDTSEIKRTEMKTQMDMTQQR